MFSWRTRSWNRKLTWQEPQKLYVFVIFYLMMVMMRWWNYVGLFGWWTRVEHVRSSSSIAATQNNKKKTEYKDCSPELVGSWSAISRRHFEELKIGGDDERKWAREREREWENILFVWRGFGWNYLIFKGVFLVDGDEWKKEVVNCWQQEIWAHQETEIECDWKILTCGSIRIYIFFFGLNIRIFCYLLMVQFVCSFYLLKVLFRTCVSFLCKETTELKSKLIMFFVVKQESLLIWTVY